MLRCPKWPRGGRGQKTLGQCPKVYSFFFEGIPKSLYLSFTLSRLPNDQILESFEAIVHLKIKFVRIYLIKKNELKKMAALL